MIDRIRHDIQERLDQLMGEVEKLRRALVALGSRDGTAAAASAPAKRAPAKRAPAKPVPAKTRTRTRSGGGSASGTRAAAATPPVTSSAKRAGGSTATPSSRARTAAGGTKNAVLQALAGGEAMTAGEVSAATGLGRASVSTTLSKLAKTGEVTKAQRGYRRAGSGPAAGATDSATVGGAG